MDCSRLGDIDSNEQNDVQVDLIDEKSGMPTTLAVIDA
jgi:hypothetical protein